MRVALIQLAVKDGESSAGRFARVETILGNLEAEKEKPDLILFPELWCCGFQNFSEYLESAEEARGKTWELMHFWAQRLHCYIHSGSFVERRSEKNAYSNTSLLFDREGEEVGRYRKVHLFGFESMEQKILTRGHQAAAAETEWGKMGMATCYDLRFPEQFRLDPVPGIFLITAAWPMARAEHWRLFNQVRAVENQCFVISCNAAGTQCGVAGAGHSMVTDPWGRILTEGGEEEEIIWCDLDPGQAEICRRTFPALQDRVPVF